MQTYDYITTLKYNKDRERVTLRNIGEEVNSIENVTAVNVAIGNRKATLPDILKTLITMDNEGLTISPIEPMSCRLENRGVLNCEL